MISRSSLKTKQSRRLFYTFFKALRSIWGQVSKHYLQPILFHRRCPPMFPKLHYYLHLGCYIYIYTRLFRFIIIMCPYNCGLILCGFSLTHHFIFTSPNARNTPSSLTTLIPAAATADPCAQTPWRVGKEAQKKKMIFPPSSFTPPPQSTPPFTISECT